LNLVDSSGWISFFTNGPSAGRFEPFLRKPSEVVTPSIVLYEVYKIIKRERTEEDALRAVGQMLKTRIIPLTDTLALEAADVSLEHGLPMVDSIVYATALANDAELVTGDADFAKLPGVTLIRREP
jgi:predicted nucleic acid-binding protein